MRHSVSTNSETLNSYASNCLAGHNAVRANDGVPALVWDEKLAASAYEWSKKMAMSRKFKHSNTRGVGENLFMGSNAQDCNAAIRMWADEKKYFSRNSVIDRNFSLYGHYTQIVWNTTRKVGCGSYGNYLTCHYDPAGNISGANPFTYRA
jgi:pathogenesis-related protein 1